MLPKNVEDFQSKVEIQLKILWFFFFEWIFSDRYRRFRTIRRSKHSWSIFVSFSMCVFLGTIKLIKLGRS